MYYKHIHYHCPILYPFIYPSIHKDEISFHRCQTPLGRPTSTHSNNTSNTKARLRYLIYSLFVNIRPYQMRSGIERAIKQSLNLRQDKGQDTAIAWVRAHIQIPGNEEADALALFSSYVGQTKGSRRTITEGGIRAEGKQRRAALRNQKGLGLGRVVAWHRQAVSAYTWMRTNKGPQRQWLYQLRKSASPTCQCGDDQIQSGDHVTFQCQLHTQARDALIRGRQSWEDLDMPNWISTGPDEKRDGVELFFRYLFRQLAGQG